MASPDVCEILGKLSGKHDNGCIVSMEVTALFQRDMSSCEALPRERQSARRQTDRRTDNIIALKTPSHTLWGGRGLMETRHIFVVYIVKFHVIGLLDCNTNV